MPQNILVWIVAVSLDTLALPAVTLDTRLSPAVTSDTT
ncbi:hypothetical protein KL86DPRO_60099 [uncultured delta proteobacterium]|uniref:Uncharacterized protein n=1 Tax=uncultured delta proteobacterium TaxID=34034 RepID=A0A212KEW2_9DELT|nr:hypothetical protein KL86DPRO_60099 [uncultured delta proteobacterium]